MSVQTRYNLNKNPAGQSFYVDNSNGIFVTKIDVWFANKPTDDSTVSLELRPMDAGVPDPMIVIPGSYVSKTNAQVQDNPNYPQTPGLNATTFEFEAPVYLNGNNYYAIVLNGSQSGYDVFCAKTEEFVLGSTERRVDKNLVAGNLFATETGYTFAPMLGFDLSFKLYVAKFDTNQATVKRGFLHNAGVPLKQLSSNPIETDGTTTFRVTHYDHGLLSGDEVVLRGVTSGSNYIGGIHIDNINGTRVVSKFDYTGYTLVAGTGTANTTLAAAVGGGDNVQASQNYQFGAATVNLAQIPVQSCSMWTGAKGITGQSYAGQDTETGYQIDPDHSRISTDRTNFSQVPYVIAASHNEAFNAADITNYDDKSFSLMCDFKTQDPYVTRFVDLQRASLTAISYRIDNQNATPLTSHNVPITYVAETNPANGSAACKHIMKPVTLEIGAKGLRIFFSGNIPKEGSIDVYYRTGTIDEEISDLAWTQLSEHTNNPKANDKNTFYDYEYIAGGEYESTLQEFDKFQVKFVLNSYNQAKVPTIADIRVIATNR